MRWVPRLPRLLHSGLGRLTWASHAGEGKQKGPSPNSLGGGGGGCPWMEGRLWGGQLNVSWVLGGCEGVERRWEWSVGMSK